MRNKVISSFNLLFFLILAFAISYEFDNNMLELTCLLLGLFGTLTTAALSVFNLKVWKASHGPDGIKYEEAFKLLVVVIFSLIILSSIFSIFQLVPKSFDSYKLASWIVGYAAMISPNLVFIFKKEVEKDSIA